jgi:hypothetical protein
MVAPEIALYWLCGWALWLSEFHRRDIYHLVFGSPLLIVLCIHALTTSRMKLANSALQLLAISAVCLAAFNFFLMAALAHPTATRVGTFTVFGEEKALAFLNEHVAPGEEILVYPYCPSYYFLSATTNPTRYSFLQYNYNTASQYQEVLSILERRRIRYVIWDTASETRDADNPSKLQPRGPNDLIIEPYLESHYKLVEDDHGVWIMERKSVAVAK